MLPPPPQRRSILSKQGSRTTIHGIALLLRRACAADLRRCFLDMKRHGVPRTQGIPGLHVGDQAVMLDQRTSRFVELEVVRSCNPDRRRDRLGISGKGPPVAAEADKFEMPLVIEKGALQQVICLGVVGFERRVDVFEVSKIDLALQCSYLSRSQGLDRSGKRQMLDNALDGPVDDCKAAVIAANKAESDELLREAQRIAFSKILKARKVIRIVIALPLSRLSKQSEDNLRRAGNRSQDWQFCFRHRCLKLLPVDAIRIIRTTRIRKSNRSCARLPAMMRWARTSPQGRSVDQSAVSF